LNYTFYIFFILFFYISFYFFENLLLLYENYVNFIKLLFCTGSRLSYYELSRAAKMDWNPRANPAHHRFGLGWVEFFLQISIRVDLDPTHLELGSSDWTCGEPGWLTNNLLIKGSHKCFYFFYQVGFYIWVMLGYFFFTQHINNLYFFIFWFVFGLY